MLNYKAYHDKYLVKLAQKGDQEAFNVLYDRHFSAVYKRVRYTIPAADVEDLTQDIFITVLRSLPSFEGRSQFRTWLRTLINRQVANYYRQRERKIQVNCIEEFGEFAETNHVGDAKHNERIAIRNALKELPPHYQEVILLRFSEGLSFKEIAKLLEQNQEAVKSLFRRAIATLRNNLEKKYDA